MLTEATGGEDDESPSTPRVIRPRTWTPEFCKEQAQIATTREDYQLAHAWKVRAYILEEHAQALLRDPERPYPFKKMTVDKYGREDVKVHFGAKEREAILGAMECGIAALPIEE